MVVIVVEMINKISVRVNDEDVLKRELRVVSLRQNKPLETKLQSKRPNKN